MPLGLYVSTSRGMTGAGRSLRREAPFNRARRIAGREVVLPGGPRWDYAARVTYPSRAAFLDMMRCPEYALANAHREAGCEDHLILATTETYSKLGRR